MSSFVQLYRYDLTQGMARNMSMMLIGRQIEGIWHTSIVVYGREFYFDGGVGIVSDSHPGATRFGRPYNTETLGTTQKPEADFVGWCTRQRMGGFGPGDYNLLHNNCNHFTQAASQFLLGRDIPSDVRDMIPSLLSTPLGRMLQPAIEQMSGVAPGSAAPLGAGHPRAPAATSPATAVPGDPPCSGLRSSATTLSASDEDDLLLAKAMLESNELISDGGSEEGFRVTLLGLTLLRSVLQNVVDHPSDAKYRGLSTTSTTYLAKLKPLEEFGATDVLRVAGFKLQSHPSSNGNRWFLSDADASAAILNRVLGELDEVIANVETARTDPLSAAEAHRAAQSTATDTTCDGNSEASREHSILRYCSAPFPFGFSPVRVGEEGGTALFSILCTARGDAKGCFGKCCLTSDHRHVKAHYCGRDGRERGIDSGYEVLCVMKGHEDEVMWVPATTVGAASASLKEEDQSMDFVFRGLGRFGVIRAPRGTGMQPGTIEPSGRCVIPYGGSVETVTESAQVLCIKSCVPQAVIAKMDALNIGETLLSQLTTRDGRPLASFDALLRWRPPTDDDTFVLGTRPSVPLRNTATRQQSSNATRLLVCHDMQGGYIPTDYAAFSSFGDGAVAGEAYTPEYWGLVDSFVYFSHSRVSVPPREWVEAGHRRGVPVLGTVITEGADGKADLQLLLTNAKYMGAVISTLVDLCRTYNFDGYLINIENSTDAELTKRLVMFVQMLRTKLRALGGARMSVVWYDAITIKGHLAYQNALTQNNKPFFDVCDGIFTNYFWNPMHIGLSRAAATGSGGRERDVYVGVDVFGRGMHGGGRFNSVVAAREAVEGGLSVALFAPGWTLQCVANGTRAGFIQAESRLWSGLQRCFKQHGVELHVERDLPVSTSFISGAGSSFCVNGVCVSGGGEWCQLSTTHTTPPLQFTEPSGSAAVTASVPFSLPLLQHGGGSGLVGLSVLAEWATESGLVWWGDRAVSVSVPASSAVPLSVWQLTGLDPIGTATRGLVVDIAWRGGAALCGSRALQFSWRAGAAADTEARWHVAVAREDDATNACVVFTTGEWCVVRYDVSRCVRAQLEARPDATAAVEVSSLAVANTTKSSAALPCVIGGVCAHMIGTGEVQTAHSPLVANGPQSWPHYTCHLTMSASRYVLELHKALLTVGPAAGDVIVVADLQCGNEKERALYLGQHPVPVSGDSIVVAFTAPPSSRVTAVRYHLVCSGF